jgi:hypothetical protein
LEKEREFLVDMCPSDKRESYEDGKETTLTRLILRKLPKEYDVAVKTVRDLHRFRAYGKEGDISKITNLEDNTRRNYETEWLPRYLELRTELIREYNLLKRRRDRQLHRYLSWKQPRLRPFEVVIPYGDRPRRRRQVRAPTPAPKRRLKGICQRETRKECEQ